MDMLGITQEILVQRHMMVLIALALHVMAYGVIAASHALAPFEIPVSLRTSWLHRLIAPWVFRAEQKLNRADRTPTKRAWRGGSVLVMVLIASWVLATAATLFFVYAIPSYYLVAVLLATLFPAGAQMLQTYHAWHSEPHTILAQGSYPEITLLDQPHVRRVRIERLGRSMIETLTIMVGFVIAELHGAFAVAMLCMLYHSVSVPSTRHIAYGALVRMLYELVCFVPAIIMTLLTCLASLVVPLTRPMAALSAIFSKGAETAEKETTALLYPAFFFRSYAAALHISLAGPYRCDGKTVQVPWVGNETAQLTSGHLITALWHSGALIFMLLLVVGAMA